MKAPATEELQRLLGVEQIAYDTQTEASSREAFEGPHYDDRRQRFEAVKRWFNDD